MKGTGDRSGEKGEKEKEMVNERENRTVRGGEERGIMKEEKE